MADLDKVLKGLQAHADGCGYRSHHCDVADCPYRYGDESCDIEEMCRDALELLKSQQEKMDAMFRMLKSRGERIKELTARNEKLYNDWLSLAAK